MAKVIEDNQLKGIRCMAHTLHLAENDGVLSQRTVNDVLATGRRIVGHFKHSQLAYSHLQSMQHQLGTQNGSNNTWVQQFLHAGKPLCTKASLGCLQRRSWAPATFTPHQWVLIEIILSVFAPFERLTNEISSSDASVADVIPSIAVQKRLLSKEVEMDHGEKTMKRTLRVCQQTHWYLWRSSALYRNCTWSEL